jgi:hypothetical protein
MGTEWVPAPSGAPHPLPLTSDLVPHRRCSSPLTSNPLPRRQSLFPIAYRLSPRRPALQTEIVFSTSDPSASCLLNSLGSSTAWIGKPPGYGRVCAYVSIFPCSMGKFCGWHLACCRLSIQRRLGKQLGEEVSRCFRR